MPCEDYPCCGHEAGDCPRIDSRGRERWRCVGCGKTLPLKAASSFCTSCRKSMYQQMDRDDFDYGMNN